MAKKQKTVRELNLEVELLSERMKKLEERDTTKNPSEEINNKVEEIERLLKVNDQKIKDLDHLLLQAQSKLNKSVKKISESNKFECKECCKEFESKNKMSDHIKKNHSQTKKCKFCEETFLKCSDLEEHLQNFHSDATQYECEDCGKKFVFEWRMKKHKTLHEESASIKYCHYFNNKIECPYKKIGCMFRHNQSRKCKFGKHCHIQLFQFQHSSNEENEKEITHEEKECFSCENCEFDTSNIEDLNKHKETNHQYEKFESMEE